jgi:hypothetical protein
MRTAKAGNKKMLYTLISVRGRWNYPFETAHAVKNHDD